MLLTIESLRELLYKTKITEEHVDEIYAELRRQNAWVLWEAKRRRGDAHKVA